MGEYHSPLFLEEGYYTEESPAFFAPLPPFFGQAENLTDQIEPSVRAAHFSGSHSFSQFSELGAAAYPTQNLDGNKTFRRSDDRSEIFTAGVTSHAEFGIPVIVGAVRSGVELVSQEYGYLVEDEALPDLVDEFGVHTPQWEPTIRFGLIEDFSSGDAGTGEFTLAAFFGESETVASRPWYDADYNQVKRNAGNLVLSKPYNHTYFKPLWDDWKALDSDARRRDNFPGFFGDEAATSETKEGRFCYFTGGLFWCNPPSLAEDEGGVKGYSGLVAVKIPMVERQNAPYLYDLTYNAETSQIYNQGITEAELTEEIFVERWLDDYGKYDPESDSQAFHELSWRPMDFDMVDTIMNGRLAPEYGGKSRCRLISADGKSYRVTLAQFAYLDPDPLVTLPPKVLLVNFPDGADFNYEFEEYPGHYFSSQLTKLEVKLGDGTYQELTLEPGMIRGRLFPGTRLFSMVQVRDGKRWGFLQYAQGGGYPDPETLIYGIERSGEARYFSKQRYRQRHNVVAQLPED